MSKEETGPPDSKIEIQLDPEIMKGVFKEEFLLDFLFIQQQPAPFGKLVSRLILTPDHAKRLLFALQENVRKYEEQFGTLDETETQPTSRTLQ